MDKTEYFELLLKQLPKSAAPQVLSRLESNCSVKTLDKGERIIKYQADNKKIFFIVSGSFIRNIITSRGEVKTIMFHTENFNEFFKSYDTIYFHHKTDYEVIANERSVILSFDFNFLYQQIQSDNSLLRYYTQKTEKLFATTDLFRNFQLALTSEEYLHWLYENYGFLFQRFPAQNIASFMGITPVWLSKLKAKPFLKLI
jgi:signal-transduction protein with cAMP-binding, CBS, and nucleotidyltransferase domain